MMDIYDHRGIKDSKRHYKDRLIGKCTTRKMTRKEIEKYSKYTGDKQKVNAAPKGTVLD